MATEEATADSETEEHEAPRKSRKLTIAAGAIGTALTIGLLFFVTREGTPEPEELFAESLNLLDRGDVRRAGNVARYLSDENYRDLEFGGGVEFVLGMSEFELGTNYSVDKHTKQRHFQKAAAHLKQAFDEGLPLDRRARWAYAHGLSLYNLDRRAEAESRLVEAIEEYPAGKRELTVALAHCDLSASVRSEERLRRTIRLCDELLADTDASPTNLANGWLLRGEAVFYADGAEVASQWLNRSTVPEELADDPRLDILQARIANATGRAAEGIEQLKDVLALRSVDPNVSRKAMFYLGEFYESQGDEEAAITAYRKIISDYDRGDETSVAAVRLGDLVRRPPRTLYEDAVQSYSVAVRIGIEPDNFRNDYTSLDDLRAKVRGAWQDWLAIGEYRWAIELSDKMAPLFPKADAADMTATAAHSQAQELQQQYDNANEIERAALRPEVLASWRASGSAYAKLAKARVVQSAYADAVWNSADHFARGHDFKVAQEQTELFLATGTESRRPRAMVNYGRLLMNMHHPGDALLRQAVQSFERMLAEYPTSDAAFDARFALGECYLELDRPTEAEQQWRAILEDDFLSPASLIWQDALVALGSLHYHVGEQAAMQSRAAAKAGDADNARIIQFNANRHWSDSIRELGAYLARTPDTPRSAKSRFWLAKSLQRSIEFPRSQLDTAETTNARIELERQINVSLAQAVSEFQYLRDRLTPAVETGKLDKLNTRLLRDSTFELAHTYFLMEDDQAALNAYSEAVNSYPNDPQVILAYVQSARCYDRLGQLADARSQLQRAKVIHEQLEEKLFKNTVTSFDAKEWGLFLDRTLELLQRVSLTGAS